MLFDFNAYIEELKENPEKKELIEKYEKLLWKIQWDTKDQVWYQEYVDTFTAMDYKVPWELEKEFDWEMLMKLVASSLSSEWLLEFQEDKWLPEFIISVQNWDQVVVKKISELWGFQILRLYEIYIEEQMNLQILMTEDEKEKEAIMAQRESRQHRWEIIIDSLEREKLEKQAKKEKEDKLSQLRNQL